MDIMRKIIMHCQKGNSDKVYIVYIIKPNDYKYEVVATYGRRGKNLKTIVKSKHSRLNLAEDACNDLVYSKEKKGYMQITDVGYYGPVKEQDYDYIEQSVKTVVEPKLIDEEFEVKCIDNINIENEFDKGITYLAKESNNEHEIQVENKFGVYGIYLLSRFEKVE